MGRAGEKDILCRISPDTEVEIKKREKHGIATAQKPVV